MDKLYILVKALREAQKKYFKSRNWKDLNECKRLEKEVDALLEKIGSLQPTLF